MVHSMRHSVSKTQKTYDRRYIYIYIYIYNFSFTDIFSLRTSFEKKRKAVDWCGNNTIKWWQEDDKIIIMPESKHIKTSPHQRDSMMKTNPTPPSPILEM
jgi:hypothetical protein